MPGYDDIIVGEIITEEDLEFRNVRISNNSLIAVPTGLTAPDGSPEMIIKTYDQL